MHRHANAHPLHPALRPPRWQRRLVAMAALGVALTGIAWLLLHYGRGAEDLPHPAEAWLIRLHGLAAFAALFAAGVLAGHHVPAAWRIGHRPARAGQRRSGVLLGLGWALTAATGYGLYYLVPEAWRPALGWGHAGLGLATVTAGGWHARARARAAGRRLGRVGRPRDPGALHGIPDPAQVPAAGSTVAPIRNERQSHLEIPATDRASRPEDPRR